MTKISGQEILVFSVGVVRWSKFNHEDLERTVRIAFRNDRMHQSNLESKPIMEKALFAAQV